MGSVGAGHTVDHRAQLGVQEVEVMRRDLTGSSQATQIAHLEGLRDVAGSGQHQELAGERVILNFGRS